MCRACGTAATLLFACALDASVSAVQHLKEAPDPRALVEVLAALAGAGGREDRSMLFRSSPARLDTASWFLARLLVVVPLLVGDPELDGTMPPEVVRRTT